ncbi:ATP-dependent DNA helicase RecG [Xylanimonas cellulosilytica DSM 15894]|uniref:Probable DNA 3'-5' helicase RecG n=1 Tax=Xylanimonas cellulosilytica (strain DSM 15894 / JCM 12276 / CECT 5975 / KCTC 9989 / LMG 20990 / NBRC 107835 / XIL07) TaxID=446471 RepID=D1BV58_XYLCX|nr:ATP-dependent DNA helicase RecG [Xylanimonas cellulosilytica]ACZ31297.1 ATP-dependent DNA helicase RecG [Xylanimonas cellulosilytica DSM 15894]
MSGPGGRLQEPLTRLLGTRTGNALAKMGLATVDDLLRHYPRRYAEPGQLTDMAKLAIGEHVSVLARVERTAVRSNASRNGARLEAVVSDGRHELTLTFFAKHPGALRYHEQRLVGGASGVFTGVVGVYRGTRQLTHPDYLMVGEGGDVTDDESALYLASLPIPMYPATASMPTWKIQRCVRTVLDTLTEDDVPDPVPLEVRARAGLPSRYDALKLVHTPQHTQEAYRGRHRLRFEEAFVLQAAIAQRRARTAAEDATARPARPGGLLDRFDAALPFTLTSGQVSVGEDLAYDLAQPRPMQRLLQGEVGSGKTVVALRAMLQVIDAGGQAALLAPTEVLAAQHARTLRTLLGPLAEGGLLGGAEDGTRVALLTGSLPAAARKTALLQAASGEAGVVVGTHALLSENVQFADLGLVVVDEQHRFGVEQRDALRAKGKVAPHLLVMTATPIPRTVAMTVFGDLEVSSLTQIPAGRAGISTVVVPAANPRWMQRTWQRVREEVDAGHRAYVVCPRIHPDDEVSGKAAATDFDDVPDFLALSAGDVPDRTPLRAVLEVADQLRETPALAGLAVDVLHGQLPPAEKDAAMTRFAAGTSQVLVSTTVIEVGVDVPEATVMVVFDADRFGLSQLHQLRGRVGRGSAPGLCLLVSTAEPGTPAAARVEALAETTDGFRLAQLDLELRSEGDVLGAAQSGRTSGLRLLRVVKDADLIEEARREAAGVVAADVDLAAHPALAAAIAAQLDPDQEEFLDRA